MSEASKPPRAAAGGWGALKSVGATLVRQSIAIKGARTMLAANQPDGFDCPGCAWPDRNHASSFEFCENGVKAVASEATAKRCTPALFAQHTVSELRQWVAQSGEHVLELQGRLTHPMRYDSATDRYVETTWDEALSSIAQTLKALASPNDACFYTSGRASNEAAFMYQLMVRAFGTNNFPDCSNMCHEASGVAMREQMGVGKGTVTLDDFSLADAIFVWGQNPGTNHPRMLGELRAAHERGARVVALNPMRERGLLRFADPQNTLEMLHAGSEATSTHYFQLQIAGDEAAALGMAKFLLEAHDAGQAVFDAAFLAEHTEGFEVWASAIRKLHWAQLVQASGLTEPELRELGALFAKAERAIFCWGMGITQHRNSVATIGAMGNLLLLRGHIGKAGAGACPVRGHSNVQGDRTMGIWEQPPQAFLSALEREFGFSPPREPGVDTLGALQAMHSGAPKVFFALGGNFASAAPDTAFTVAGLRRCALTVQVSTKLNRSHLEHGHAAYILPCLGRTEIDMQASGAQAITVEDSMSMVHASKGINAPASPHLRSEPWVVAELAVRLLGPEQPVPWREWAGNYAFVREGIARCIEGFERFNERIAQPGGFHLRNPAREREWRTASGKAQLVPPSLALADADDQAPSSAFTLMTVRSHDQYNTTIYGLDDRYRGIKAKRRVLFMHPADAQEQGLAAGDLVRISTRWAGDAERSVSGFEVVPYNIPRGNLAAYYPETNPLVPANSADARVGTPASKSIPVALQKE